MKINVLRYQFHENNIGIKKTVRVMVWRTGYQSLPEPILTKIYHTMWNN